MIPHRENGGEAAGRAKKVVRMDARYIKGVLQIFLYSEYMEHVDTYLYIHVIKHCHQHSYGFQNLMSSWGVGIFFSKSQ